MDGHGVERVLHLVRHARRQPPQRRHAPRELGDLAAGRALGGQAPHLRADRVEDAAQVLHLGLFQVEGHAELAASEARQAALNDVNGTQHRLGQEERHQHRDQQRAGGRGQRRVHGIGHRSLHEQRRDADADVAEGLVFEQQRGPPLQRASAGGPDFAQLQQRVPRQQLVEAAGRGEHQAHLGGIAVRDRHACWRRRWRRG